MSKEEEDDETQLKTDQEIQLKTEKMTEFQSWLALQQLNFEAGSEDLVIWVLLSECPLSRVGLW